MKTETPPAPGQVMSVPVSAITVLVDHNPRARESDEDKERLEASIRADGLLTPLLVRRRGDGFDLVAGHRRLCAARAVGLSEVSVLVKDDGDVAVLALMENVARANLDPVEEARALLRVRQETGITTQAALSERLGVSGSWVRSRLRIAELPVECQEAIGAGRVPLAAVDVLHAISRVSAPLCVACVALVTDEEDDYDRLSAQDLVAYPAAVVRAAAARDEDIVAIEALRTVSVSALPLAEEILERARRLSVGWIALGSEVEDAARAYGCLLEIPDGHYGASFICDAGLLADRVRVRLDEIGAAREGEAPEAAAASPGIAPPAGLDRDAFEEAVSERLEGRELSDLDEADRDRITKDAARQVRAAGREQRAAAHRANTTFGIALAKKHHAPTLSVEIARLLAHVVSRYLDQAGPDGLRLCAPGWQKMETATTKAGRTSERVVYPTRAEAKERLSAWLLEPKGAKEILGRITQALLALAFADQEAVARSDRGFDAGFSPFPEGARESLLSLVDGLLPEHLDERVRDAVGPGRSFDAVTPREVTPAAERLRAHLRDLGAEALAGRFPRIAWDGEAGEGRVSLDELTPEQAAWLLAEIENQPEAA